ncbi:MAG: AAA family ATPase [Rikenellaceae bacterium]|jgi:predicted ATPase|nr:AAA family ATPase [Rikenellaceae bacterium]
MKESIIIRNFGPVEEVAIDDIRPMTVFIGESGSGKSTIMKTLVLFRWIYKWVNIRSYLRYSNISQSPFKFDFISYLKNDGTFEYLKPQTEIIYQKGSVTIHYKNKLATTPIVPADELGLDKMCFIGDKRNTIPDILANGASVKGFFVNETYNDFMIASKWYVNELDIPYLGVKYFSKKMPSGGVKYYIGSIGDSKKFQIGLENASSGIQTVTPLSVIVEYFSKHYDLSWQFNKVIFDYMSRTDSLKNFRAQQNIGDVKYRNVHIHIEEPELGLYPESQRSLINFIVNRCFVQKHNDYGMTLMLTTHSPYIINHLNLLIRAGDKNRLVEGAKIDYDDLSVFEVREGQISDLKIVNKHLIYTNPLSDTINDIYDEYNQL